MVRLNFCPRCGGRLASGRPTPHEPERLVCAQCGRIHYLNSKVCGGVLLVRDGRALLAQRGVEPRRHYWDIPGGFLEPGEHPSEGAIREAREELGVEVQLGPLLGMFMDTYETTDGLEHTLSVYYLVECFSGEPRPDDDVEALAWFTPEDVPAELAFPHLRRVIDAWRTPNLDPGRVR